MPGHCHDAEPNSALATNCVFFFELHHEDGEELQHTSPYWQFDPKEWIRNVRDSGYRKTLQALLCPLIGRHGIFFAVMCLEISTFKTTALIADRKGNIVSRHLWSRCAWDLDPVPPCQSNLYALRVGHIAHRQGREAAYRHGVVTRSSDTF